MKAKTWYSSIFLHCAIVLFTGTASAQTYPSKPIRWIVPYPAGGPGDFVVRTLSGPMAKSLGQNVIADFRPGGDTIVGTELTARAPADGYTLLFVSNSFASNPVLRSKLPYDTLKDFAGVARIVTTPHIIVAHPSVPAKSLKELLALARTRPGELTFGSLALGGSLHLSMEMLSQLAKVRLIRVPYQGIAPMMISLIGGHISIAVTNVPDAVPYVEVGRLRPIAVTSASRTPALENVPTVAESGFPGYDFQLWIGAVMVRSAPREAVTRLSTEITRALEQPEVKVALGKVGYSVAPLNPEQFDTFIRTDMQTSEKVTSQANIRID